MTCPNCDSEMEEISYGWFHCLTCCGNGDCCQTGHNYRPPESPEDTEGDPADHVEIPNVE